MNVFAQITTIMRLSGSRASLRLGSVWDCKLSPFEDEKLKEVFRLAAGEMSLEAFLKDIKDFWEPFQLSIVPSKSRGKVIRGTYVYAVCMHATCIVCMYACFQAGTICSASWMSICPRWLPCVHRNSSKCLKKRLSIGMTSLPRSGTRVGPLFACQE